MKRVCDEVTGYRGGRGRKRREKEGIRRDMDGKEKDEKRKEWREKNGEERMERKRRGEDVKEEGINH